MVGQCRGRGRVETGPDRLGHARSRQPRHAAHPEGLEPVVEPVQHPVERIRAPGDPAPGGRGRAAQRGLGARDGHEQLRAHADRPDHRVQLLGRRPRQPRRGRVGVRGAPHLILGAVIGHRAHQQRHPVDHLPVPDPQQHVAQPGGQPLTLGVRQHPHPGVGEPGRGPPAALTGVVDQTHPALIAERGPIGERHPGQHPGQIRLVGRAGCPGRRARLPA